MKYCINCGNPMEDDMLYCQKCGTKSEIIQPEPITSPEVLVEKPIRKGMFILCIVFGVFAAIYLTLIFDDPLIGLSGIAFFGIISAMFYVLSKSPKDSRYILGKTSGISKKLFVIASIILAFVLFSAIPSSRANSVSSSTYTGGSLPVGETSKAAISSDPTNSAGTAVDTPTSNNTNYTKDDAENFDSILWPQMIEMIKIYNNLCSTMVGVGEGSISISDAYEYCKDVEEYIVFYKFAETTTENECAYADSVDTFSANVSYTANKLRNYLDDPSSENFSALSKSMDSTSEAMDIVINNRMVFLREEGFSENEIQSKIDAVDSQLA